MCIFCKIVNGELPSHKIYEDDDVYAFLDISCDAIGHTLVIPKVHYENILDVPNDVLSKVAIVIKKISNHYVYNCGYTGVNVMNASGIDAQQSVFHLHFHIIPRKNDDKLDTWPKLEKMEIDLKSVCDRLKILK